MSANITIVDVARVAGVAVSTASAALNGRPGVAASTRARVEAAAAEVGWIASVRGRSLSSKHTNTVGLVLQRSAKVLETDPYFGALLSGIESVLEERGYALVLQLASSLDRTVERMSQLVRSGAVDGVFITDLRDGDVRFDLVQELNAPAVATGALGSYPVPSVTQNEQVGMADLMDALAGLGHRHIAHVSGSPAMVHTRTRETIWRDGLERHGLPEAPLVGGHYTIAGGADAVAEVFEQDDRVTAVVCANDLSAVGFMARCQGLGWSVPADVSIAGFDGIQLGEYTTPSLSTVVSDPAAMGRAAAQLLLDQIVGEDAASVEVPPVRALLRNSVGAPRTGPLPRH